ncbi:MAG: hypothetical protein GF403_10170 [Candidatus Coatesbacteria bacterium]|nr:hypothetical protein [Candidatus Coatesbacteria bacterium]
MKKRLLHRMLITVSCTLPLLAIGCGESSEQQEALDEYLAEVRDSDQALMELLEEFILTIEDVRDLQADRIEPLERELIDEAASFVQRCNELIIDFERSYELEPIMSYQEKKLAVATGFIELVNGYIIFIDNFTFREEDAEALPGFFQTKLTLYSDKVIDAAENLEYDLAEAGRSFHGWLDVRELDYQ